MMYDRGMMTRISLVLGLLLAVPALAADKAEETAVAVAAARVKAEIAVKNAVAATDENRSGWASVWQLAELTRNKTYAVLENRLQAEDRKEEDQRDQTLIGQVQTRLNELRDDWDYYNAKDRHTLSNAFQDANDTVTRLAQVMEALGNSERAWREANLDMTSLQASYDGIAKRANEMREQAEKALAAAQAKNKAVEADLAAAKELIAGK